jgi:hypothetical protein
MLGVNSAFNPFKTKRISFIQGDQNVSVHLMITVQKKHAKIF